jgi:hypothetical protein
MRGLSRLESPSLGIILHKKILNQIARSKHGAKHRVRGEEIYSPVTSSLAILP